MKLLDFGIARSKQDSRLTGTGELFGTPQYMAPERITSTDAGAPSDLYALGVIFFEMLTARLPFDAPDVATFFVRHLKDPPLPIRTIHPGTPESLADLIERLLAKEPKNRPVDAHKVVADLASSRERDRRADPRSSRTPTSPSARGPRRCPRPKKERDGGFGARTCFAKCSTRAYGTEKTPDDIAKRLVRIDELAKTVADMKSKSVSEQAKLEDLGKRGREDRLRLGHAVDDLGAEASRAREELRTAEEKMQNGQEAARDRAKNSSSSATSTITYWEGRSGFAEPYEDLMNAYRDAADVIEGWIQARKQEREAERTLETHQQSVRDLEFQLMKLRESLAMHELDTEAEREAIEGLVVQLTQEIDAAEEELVSLSASLVEPLRARPELSTLFRRLEAA